MLWVKMVMCEFVHVSPSSCARVWVVPTVCQVSQFCESMPAEAQMLHAGSRSELEPIASFHQPRELLEPPRSVLKDSSVEGYIARPES